MAQLQLNKSSLAREQLNLASYERFLPSLDLKRQQLMGERAKARAELRRRDLAVSDLIAQVGRDVPMLANQTVKLDGLVHLRSYHVTTENVVGSKLPALGSVDVEVYPYSDFAKPHWVDQVVRLLRDMIEARLRLSIARQRLEIIEKAVDTVTQRVNLFEKVLIPNARKNIKRIRLYLSDEEMQAVVRSKISKRKRAAA